MRNAVPPLSGRVARPPLAQGDGSPKRADAHYLTREHRAWRAAVIERAGGACQGEGPHSGGPLVADHVRELRDGGAALDLANGQALCPRCHARKTARARSARFAPGG